MKQAQLNKINRPKVIDREISTFTPADKERFLSELKCWAELKGFKPGFAMAQYRDRFGQWPPWAMKDTPSSVNVSAETMGWIEGRRKEWVKKRKAERKAAAQLAADKGNMDPGHHAGRTAPPEDHKHYGYGIEWDDWIDLGEYRI